RVGGSGRVLAGGEDGDRLLRLVVDGGEGAAEEQLAAVSGHRVRAQTVGALPDGGVAHVGVRGPVPERAVGQRLIKQMPADPGATRVIDFREATRKSITLV